MTRGAAVSRCNGNWKAGGPRAAATTASCTASRLSLSDVVEEPCKQLAGCARSGWQSGYNWQRRHRAAADVDLTSVDPNTGTGWYAQLGSSARGSPVVA